MHLRQKFDCSKVPVTNGTATNIEKKNKKHDPNAIQKSWLKRPKLGLPWMTRPRSGNLIKTHRKTRLKKKQSQYTIVMTLEHMWRTSQATSRSLGSWRESVTKTTTPNRGDSTPGGYYSELMKVLLHLYSIYFVNISSLVQS